MNVWRGAWLAAALVLMSSAAEANRPTVSTGAATAITATGATLNGTVSDGGKVTTVTFQYGLTTSYGTTVTYGNVSGSNVAIAYAVGGLSCNTSYHFRIAASNSDGSRNGSDATFTTSACPPTVATDAATNETATTATLNGTVSSNGDSTTVTFDYGTTASYGSTASYASNPLASTASNASVLAAITGLTCNTTYHFRVRATNSAGTANGSERTFATATCPTAVTLAKTASSSASVVNSYISFEINATNETGGTLSNVVVTDVLPAGMTYSASSATLGTATVSGQTVTWSIPALPAGYSGTLTLVVQLTQKGSLTNTVTSPGATSASATVLVLPKAITTYRMDEPTGSWNGTTGEVVDSGGNGLNGHRRQNATTTTNTVAPNPTIAAQFPTVSGGFCNAGNFDGNAVVESASSTYFQFKNVMSASAWIYPTAYPTSDLYSILSNDVNYEFHLDTNGKLFWWWNYSTLTSAATIPLNQWTHVAITLDSTSTNHRQRIYINGVQDTNTNNWQGTLQTNTCPFYIGGDIGTGSGCALIPARNFHGMIDEVSIYDYEMTAAEVQAAMKLGRQCSGTFHHIEIDHDGSASVCTSKTVTLKACLDAGCTVLYPGTVSVQLSPTGWTPSDVVTISGGVATATLSNTALVAPSVTLGTTSVTPTPSNATTCDNGTTQSCTLNVVSLSCLADAVEVGANPYTNLYTKLAGTAFNIDVLAISSGAVNTLYTGTMTVDAVDANTGCSASSTALNTSQAVTFAASDKGRKTVSMPGSVANRKAQVRIKIGSAYACSADKFAIRPSSVSLTTTPTMATPPSASDTHTLAAGGGFILSASGTSGYTGTLTQNAAKITAQTTTQASTIASGGAVGSLTPASLVANQAVATNNATYSEVGYAYLAMGTFADSDFTAVDRSAGDCITDTTSDNNFSTTLVGSTGKYGCDIGSLATSLGRFVPHHFDTAVIQGCAPTYTYSAQPFDLTVTARNATGGATQNYQGSYSKAVALSDANAVSGGTLEPKPPKTVGASKFSSGVADVKRTDPDTPPSFTFTRASPDHAPGTIKLRATDGESSSATGTEGTVLIRIGRLRLSNVYGYQSPLQMPVEAQYWTGNSWVKNGDDSCTVLSTANIYRSVAGWTRTGPGTLVGGAGVISLVPSAAGSATVCADLGADPASGVTCVATSAALPWLKGMWPPGADWDNDPSATATFGIFSPENRRGIYNREMY